MGGLGGTMSKSPSIHKNGFTDESGLNETNGLNETATLKKIMPNISSLSQLCHLTTKDSS